MRYRIGFCCEDINYTKALMEYINLNWSDKLISCCFTDYERLVRERMYADLDAIVTDWLITDEKLPVKRVYLRSDIRFEEKDDIYKYQSAAVIARKLYERLELWMSKRNKKKTYPIYSPIGRCGKTTLALGLSCNGKADICICFCSYPGELLLGASGHSAEELVTFSDDFMYYAATHNKKLIEVLDNVRRDRDSPLIFPVLCSQEDVLRLSEDDYAWLREILFEYAVCGVAIDFECTGMDIYKLKGLGECLYVPYADDSKTYFKLEDFKQASRGSAEQEVYLRFVSVPDAAYDGPEVKSLVDSIS